MAGDWIKMRGNLWDDPRVSGICDLIDATEASVIGGLYWLWSTADQHTEDGILPGLTLRSIDRKTALPGFGSALVDIGWVETSEDGITIVRFDEHNGTSAKRRCMEAQRKANSRKLSANDADTTETADAETRKGCVAREREREDISTTDVVDKPHAKRASLAKPDDVSETVWADFLATRKAKRSLLTETALQGIRREADKIGFSLEEALQMSCARGWQSFKADWVKHSGQANKSSGAMASYGTIFTKQNEVKDHGRVIDATPCLG